MRTTFVSTTFRKDLEKWVHGVYIRMGMFVEALKSVGELDMLFYVDDKIPITSAYRREVESYLSNRWDVRLRLTLCHLAPNQVPTGRWETIVNPAISIYNHPLYARVAGKKQVNAFNQMLLRKPDMVFVHRLSAMVPVLRSKERLPKVFFDLDDIEHVSFFRNIRTPPWWGAKPLRYLQVPSLLIGEHRAIRFAHKTFVCSDHDRNYIRRFLGLRNILTIPNAIEIPEEEGMGFGQKLLFIGSFEYYPNTVAADHLISRIWPLITAKSPFSELLIVGESPQNIAGFRERPKNVQFCGFERNLERLYREVRVVCCPILTGGGTRLKILEACSYARPVVSTTIGAEGLNLRDKEEIFLCDQPATFAEACIKLLGDRNLAMKVGQAARSAVVNRFSRRKVIEEIKSTLMSPSKEGKTLNGRGRLSYPRTQQ